MSEPNIVLIGMMGSGKTTVGQLLADALHRPYIDTDKALEARIGRTIVEIFQTDGEAAFRQLEAEMVEEVAKRPGQVISTGGGVILNQKNVQFLQKTGIIIFLYTSPDVILTRLAGDQTRPLLQTDNPLQRLTELYFKRLPLYRETADVELITDKLTPAEVAGQIQTFLQEKCQRNE